MADEPKETWDDFPNPSSLIWKGTGLPYHPKLLNLTSKLMKKFTHPTILDVGGGDRRIQGSGFVNFDRCKYPGMVDVVGDAHQLPFRSSTFDLVLCQAVLEHCRKPWVVTKEIWRVCKPGGFVYVDNAFMQPYHPSPRHFFNTTREGLEVLLEGFEKIESGVNEYQMPSYTVTWVLAEYILSFFKKDAFFDKKSFRTSVGPCRRGIVVRLLWVLYNLLLSFLRRCDSLINPDNVENLSCGVFFLGRKPTT